jgi:hypothetical protein
MIAKVPVMIFKTLANFLSFSLANALYNRATPRNKRAIENNIIIDTKAAFENIITRMDKMIIINPIIKLIPVNILSLSILSHQS